MSRTVFFSFRYEHVFRVNQIRSIPNVTGVASAGFKDASLWEQVKNNERTIKRHINDALHGTSVTVVFITYGTSKRRWINYELDQSLARGNGLLGIRIHHLFDGAHPDNRRGATPKQIANNNYRVYDYKDARTLARHIEQAARQAGR